MARSRKKRTKRPTRSQVGTLRHAWRVLKQKRDHGPQAALKERNRWDKKTTRELKDTVILLNAKVDGNKRKYYAEKRRFTRQAATQIQLKHDTKALKEEVKRLQQWVERANRDASVAKEDAREGFLILQTKIRVLDNGQKELVKDRDSLRRQNKRVRRSRQMLMKQMKEAQLRRPYILRSNVKGVYTPRFRALARYLASTGTAESKIGTALKEIAGVMGMDLDRLMSTRTVQRCILEGGIAADLQLALEMAKSSKLCYSSDSTSHKRIEYESRHVAMQVIDYSNPSAEPQWKLRSLGVDTSVDHSSETQMSGLRARLDVLSQLFNSSPLAVRTNLRFKPDDFAYKLIGTCGDHAADQKKSHRLMAAWKMEVVVQRLGEQTLFTMEIQSVVPLLMSLTARQIELKGGQDAWDRLSEDEKNEALSAVVREVGRQTFENLPSEDQERLVSCVRVGCCMHKDLNCFKWGDKAMQGIWETKHVRPITLASKDNAEVLAGVKQGAALTRDQERAFEASKRGGCKAVELAGLICKNSDTKKGQQDLYRFFMKEATGREVPFPDVSKTRYGSHGEGAGTIITHLDAFRSFSRHIRDTKDRPGHTNIEKNFMQSLTDIPTLTELVVLALYNVAVSRPFMCFVRQTPNLLDLEPFFQRKQDFLDHIISNPKIWTANTSTHEDVYLDGSEPKDFAVDVFEAAHKLAPDLPNLDDAVIAFAKGAREAFVERFSEEFREGGGIDRLTTEERKELFFPSTNDVNEGALGAWRLAQRHRVAETLHKFNASKKAATNDTETFIMHTLTQPEDQTYLRRSARSQDEAKLHSKIKTAQIQADTEKATRNREKETTRQHNQLEKEAELTKTGNNLVLNPVIIITLKKDDLNRQIDFHRNAELGLDIPVNARIPPKSCLKNNAMRIDCLKAALLRYLSRIPHTTIVSGDEVVTATADKCGGGPEVYDGAHEYDYYDDHC